MGVLEGGGGREGEREGRREGKGQRDGSEKVWKECVRDIWRGERIRTGRQCPTSGNLQIHSQ